jgi:hypothetical protein
LLLAACSISTNGTELFADQDGGGSPQSGGTGGGGGVDPQVSESGGASAVGGSFGPVGSGGAPQVDGSVPSLAPDAGAGGMAVRFEAGMPKFPLKASPNGRYLVDQNGAPFLVAGDAPQALMVRLSEAEMTSYFATRAKQGFDAAWVNLLCNSMTGGSDDASTFDGIVPFTAKNGSDYDISKPNPAYFTRVDAAIAAAAKAGIVVFLNPIETYGFLGTLQSNGVSAARAYGQYLGQRYANTENILWLHGNSFNDWRSPDSNSLVQAVALGIKEKDTRHLHTIELDDSSSSLEDADWFNGPSPILGLNSIWTLSPTYARLYADYNRAAFLPNVIIETRYEGDSFGDPHDTNAHDCRSQYYWAALSGGAGSFYGNHVVYSFASGWQSHVNDGGAAQVQHLRALFAARAWQNLVPDQTHAVVVSGYGTYSDVPPAQDNTYATTARAADGTLVMTYMPSARAITVDMTKLSAAAVARWYDPVAGTFTPVDGSPFAPSGTKSFTPPAAKHADGYTDWVLVLETAPRP